MSITRSIVVFIVQHSILNIHYLGNLDIVQAASDVDDVAQGVPQGGLRVDRCIDGLGGQTGCVESVARHVIQTRGRVGRLPLPPHAVDVVVVEEENGVAGRRVLISHLRLGLAWNRGGSSSGMGLIYKASDSGVNALVGADSVHHAGVE
jgi:hypothetical protein